MRIRAALALLASLLTWVSFVAVRTAAHDATRAASPGSGRVVRTSAPPARELALPWPAAGQAALEVDGRFLGTSGGGRPVPIASLAKVMTGYLVLRDHPLSGGRRGFTVTLDGADVRDFHHRAANDESVVPVEAGEILGERQLLEALLLPSGNNIAIVLAAHVAGSVGAFVDRMNDAARGLGMRDTTYTDPSGLEPRTVSTAADQLRVVRAAMRLPAFAEIVATPSITLPVAGLVENTNPLLYLPDVVGVKTGSDDAAGGCLAFAAVRGGVTVLGVVLGQRDGPLLDAAANAARPLIDAGFTAAVAVASR